MKITDPHAWVDKMGATGLKENKYVKIIKDKTGLNETYIILMGISLVLIFLALTSYGRSVIITSICVLYPAYKSFQSLKTVSLDDDKKWLTYWVVYGFVMTIEPLLNVLIKMFPFYAIFKFVFLISLIHGQTNGYQIMFHYVIVPVLTMFDSQIEEAIAHAENVGGGVIGMAKKKAAEVIAKNVDILMMDKDDVVNKGKGDAQAKIDAVLKREEEINILNRGK